MTYVFTGLPNKITDQSPRSPLKGRPLGFSSTLVRTVESRAEEIVLDIMMTGVNTHLQSFVVVAAPLCTQSEKKTLRSKQIHLSFAASFLYLITSSNVVKLTSRIQRFCIKSISSFTRYQTLSSCRVVSFFFFFFFPSAALEHGSCHLGHRNMTSGALMICRP